MTRPIDALDLAEIGRLLRRVETGPVADFAEGGFVTVIGDDGEPTVVPIGGGESPRERAEQLVEELERYGFRIVKEG